MNGFFTSSFMEDFPKSLKQSIFSKKTSRYDLFLAMKSGRLIVGTQGISLVSVLESLKQEDFELFQIFSSLEAAGKLKGVDVSEEISEDLKEIKIRKSILKRIAQGYSQPVDIVYHDNVGANHWKEEIINSGYKPLIDNEDLNNGNVDYLFQEQSIPLNKGVEFNWSRFLADYLYPFKQIRILDPYLFTNVHSIDLNNILKTLLSKCNTEKVCVEIISNLSVNGGERVANVLEKVKKTIEIPNGFKVKLYSQKGSASRVFHKRVIWTDFWALNAERGFDFLKLEKGKGTVTKENTLFMTGKYSSKNSLWYQIINNWTNYLNLSREIEKE